jgi:hypothetical protein
VIQFRRDSVVNQEALSRYRRCIKVRCSSASNCRSASSARRRKVSTNTLSRVSLVRCMRSATPRCPRRAIQPRRSPKECGYKGSATWAERSVMSSKMSMICSKK